MGNLKDVLTELNESKELNENNNDRVSNIIVDNDSGAHDYMGEGFDVFYFDKRKNVIVYWSHFKGEVLQTEVKKFENGTAYVYPDGKTVSNRSYKK